MTAPPTSRSILVYNRLRAVYDLVPIGIVLTDIDGRISHGNAFVVKLFGYPDSTLIRSHRLTDLIVDGHKERLNALLEEVQLEPTDQDTVSVELRCRKRSGAEIYCRILINPIVDPKDAGQTYLIVTFQDITQSVQRQMRLNEAFNDSQRNIEELEKQKSKLQQSNEELEQFAAVASHDLQEPPRQIAVFAGRILDTERESLSDKTVQYLQIIEGSAKRMQTLVSDLLSYSRVNRKGADFAQCNLSDVLDDVLTSFQTRIEETGAEVVATPLPSIEADGRQMHQLLGNLISNALKFSHEDRDPKIEIRAESANPDTVRIHITDNGIGFEPEYRHTVFDIFKRLVGRVDYPGTGIGLAICKRIVDRHGGCIEAHSTPDVGTTFIVTLPRRHKES